MSVLDVFSDSAFDMASLTVAIDKLPRIPGRIGQMGLFQTVPVNTLTAQIEERHGRLSLLKTGARGTAGSTDRRRDRKVRSFSIPHIPHDDAVQAEEVQGVRAFGSETQLETVANVVNEKMTQMKQNHEITWEYHRAGCLQGIVLDADGSTIYNWFTEFGITEKVVDFDFAGSGDPKLKSLEVLRHIRNALGGTPFREIHALCGNDFFDAFVDHADVKESYERYQANEFARTQQFETPFKWGGITWENYDFSVGTKDYVPAAEARFFPLGAPNIFQRINAPANFIETVNTMGRDIYVKQERQKFDTGVDLTSQSNPLHICTRPSVLVKGTIT